MGAQTSSRASEHTWPAAQSWAFTSPARVVVAQLQPAIWRTPPRRTGRCWCDQQSPCRTRAAVLSHCEEQRRVPPDSRDGARGVQPDFRSGISEVLGSRTGWRYGDGCCRHGARNLGRPIRPIAREDWWRTACESDERQRLGLATSRSDRVKAASASLAFRLRRAGCARECVKRVRHWGAPCLVRGALVTMRAVANRRVHCRGC